MAASDRPAQLTRASFIGSVVIAPLNEARAESFAPMAFESNSVAPFDEVGVPEDILVVRPSPNYHKGGVADWIEPVVNDRLCALHFNELGRFYGLRSDKKEPRGVSVHIVWWNGAARRLPVNADRHFVGRGISSIFPSWLSGKAPDVELRIDEHYFDWNVVIRSRCEFAVEAVNDDKGAVGGGVLLTSFGNSSPKPVSLTRSDEYEQPSENGEPEIRNSGSMPKDNPKFASFISAATAVVVSVCLQWWGWARLSDGRRIRGALYLGVGALLTFSGTVGLLLGFDPFSLWQLL